jgi:eukaryotic-like serine/threonine-protein kinase
VPNVSGKSEHSASVAISNTGLVPTVYYSISSSVPRGRVMGQLPLAGKQELNGEDVAIVVSGGRGSSATSVTPNVVGMSKARAQKAVVAAGLVPQTIDVHDSSVAKGYVVRQVPAAGAKADPDQDVVIAISQGPISKVVRTVPSVTGKSKSQAQSVLAKASLGSLASWLFSARVAKGKVMGQLPRAGAKLLRQAPVTMVLSLGKPTVPGVVVPNVAGKSRASALAAMSAAGLDPIDTLVFTNTAPPDTAYMQYPTAGTKVEAGSKVVVVMAR